MPMELALLCMIMRRVSMATGVVKCTTEQEVNYHEMESV